MKRRIVPSAHRAGNVTSAGLQTLPATHKKAALKRRIQDILNGRSRFLIRKVPAAGSTHGGGQTPSGGEGGASPSPPREEEKKDRCFHMQHLLDLSARATSRSRFSVPPQPRLHGRGGAEGTGGPCRDKHRRRKEETALWEEEEERGEGE